MDQDLVDEALHPIEQNTGEMELPISPGTTDGLEQPEDAGLKTPQDIK